MIIYDPSWFCLFGMGRYVEKKPSMPLSKTLIKQSLTNQLFNWKLDLRKLRSCIHQIGLETLSPKSLSHSKNSQYALFGQIQRCLLQRLKLRKLRTIQHHNAPTWNAHAFTVSNFIDRTFWHVDVWFKIATIIILLIQVCRRAPYQQVGIKSYQYQWPAVARSKWKRSTSAFRGESSEANSNFQWMDLRENTHYRYLMISTDH